MTLLSRLARRGLKKIGFVRQTEVSQLVASEVSHLAAVDFRELCHDPLDAARRTQGFWFIIEVPFPRLRDLHPIVPSWNANPYFLTAKQYIANKDLVYDETPLRRYFESVIPENAAEVLESRSQTLASMSPLEADLPWRHECGPQVKRGKLGRAERQAGEHGVQLSQADGDYAMGPVSRAKGEFEFVRLTKVIDSIRQYGYVPQTRRENISGYIMEADGDWAVMIQSGSHRAPALYALGWRSVPVLIKANKTVRRQELASWPCVRNGQMTPEEALKLFDRVLREEDPAWLKARWCDARRNASG